MRKHKVLVPLRGGSKSIPKKNIKKLMGMPLAYWCLKAASDAPAIDEVIVATDDAEIAEVVMAFGLNKLRVYRRKAENATDQASTESVMLEVIENEGWKDDDAMILVQATSPFTQSGDLNKAIEMWNQGGFDSLLSVVPMKRFFWDVEGKPINYDPGARPRRQDFDGCFMENGAFYINTVKNITKHHNRLSGKVAYFPMPEFTALELDEPEDWELAEFWMRSKGFKAPLPNIKLFATDVDGVLTDASMYYTAEGDAMKRFNTHDGMGLQLLQKAGIKTAIITSENTQIVAKRAEKLGVDFLFQGKKHGGKLEAIQLMCAEMNIGLHEVAYVGDDINCKEALSAVGLAACPANALPSIKQIPGIRHLETVGGSGAIRELVEMILA